ncbi:MAG: nuclear transport factor 2 family protein [Burkholderiales bacterium]|nr:nuclear transport factor 2 family protein [Burkholderiales bacterium]
MTEAAKQEVLAAAKKLLDAFAANDLDGYFGSFAPEATFIFHSVAEPLRSTAAYRAAWAEWEKAIDLRIVGCTCFDQDVRFLTPDVALYSHSVRVEASTTAGVEQRKERETVVFVRQPDGGWLALHEHLSKDPNP